MDVSHFTAKDLKALFFNHYEEHEFDSHGEWMHGAETMLELLGNRMRGGPYCLRWDTVSEDETIKEHFINTNRFPFFERQISKFLSQSAQESVAFLVHKERVPSWNRDLWWFIWEPGVDENSSSSGAIAHLETREAWDIRRILLHQWLDGDKTQVRPFYQEMLKAIDEMDLVEDEKQLAFLLTWAK